MLGGMDLSGYDNTISVGQLKTRPDQSLAGSGVKEYLTTSCLRLRHGDLRPEQASSVWRNKKRRIDKESGRRCMKDSGSGKLWNRRRPLSGERSTAWRKKKNRFVSGSGRQSGPGGNRASISAWWTRSVRQNGGSIRWRSSFFLLPLWRQFFSFQRPLNYFVVIVVFLACTVYVWNRMKVGKDKNQVSPEEIMEEILPEEERASVEKFRMGAGTHCPGAEG